MKRGKLAGSLVQQSKAQTNEFCRSIVQGIRAWAATAPNLPIKVTDATPAATSEPPRFSSGDREFGDAQDPSG
jgi:hypothetical protein